jgi:hypothetical protein
MATTTSIVKFPGTADLPGQDTALTMAPVSSLPTIAEMRQKMAWMTEFRAVLLEFVQRHMDPARHMYSFKDNKYTPLTREMAEQMTKEGKKPSLNQDGIHNLMSLYECYIDEPKLVETREDGFYTCRATVTLISFRSGHPMGAGIGSCSTRETKYAYRWVGVKHIPKGLDQASLKSRSGEDARGNKWQQWRIVNDDLTDVEATVLQLAIKRAKSSAVKGLPLASEMFASIGDPDEDQHEGDINRQELLKPLGAWMRSIKKTSDRGKAILAIFGEPLTYNDIQKLEEEQLVWASMVLEIARKAGVDWGSPTIVEDVQNAKRQSARQAKEDLFGDETKGTTTDQRDIHLEPQGGARDVSHAKTQERHGPEPVPEGIDPATGELFDLDRSAMFDREDNPET